MKQVPSATRTYSIWSPVGVFALLVALLPGPGPVHAATYDGREPGAAWRTAATGRIEQYRKADIQVHVTDRLGNPLSSAEVHVQMLDHAFGFGTAVAPGTLIGTGSDNDNYRDTIAQYFNKAVIENDLKWPYYTSRWESDASPALDWLAGQGIETRGHWISHGQVNKDAHFGNHDIDTVFDDLDHAKQLLFDHMADKLPTVGARVSDWDLINHIVGWSNPPKTLAAEFGGNQIYEEIIIEARRLAPTGMEMWVNEGQILSGGSRRTRYASVIEDLILRDAAPDGAGFMGHFKDNTLTSPEQLYQVMDDFAGIVPKLKITELDYATTDEQLQADYIRDVLTVGFSHPNMEAILQWGFWEGEHHDGSAALWRQDWSIKPVGEAYIDLVFNQWWTDELLDSGLEGDASTRGFLGQYEIEVTFGQQTETVLATLGSGGLDLTVVVPEPASLALLGSAIAALAAVGLLRRRQWAELGSQDNPVPSLKFLTPKQR